ncbi:Son of sevenless 2 [Dionaea muscipula]
MNLYDVYAVFEDIKDYVKRQTRFVSRQPAKVIISTIETIGESMGLMVHTRCYKVAAVSYCGQWVAAILLLYAAAVVLLLCVATATSVGNSLLGRWICK